MNLFHSQMSALYSKKCLGTSCQRTALSFPGSYSAGRREDLCTCAYDASDVATPHHIWLLSQRRQWWPGEVFISWEGSLRKLFIQKRNLKKYILSYGCLRYTQFLLPLQCHLKNGYINIQSEASLSNGGTDPGQNKALHQTSPSGTVLIQALPGWVRGLCTA